MLATSLPSRSAREACSLRWPARPFPPASSLPPSPAMLPGTYCLRHRLSLRTTFSASRLHSGLLTPLAGNPFPAGNAPSAIVVDPSFNFAYVANATDSTVTAYSISNGASPASAAYSVGLQPVAIGIDPSTNHFLYTVNFLGNNVSGFELSQTAGTLLHVPVLSLRRPTTSRLPSRQFRTPAPAPELRRESLISSLLAEPEQVATPRSGLLQYLRGNLNEFSWG